MTLTDRDRVVYDLDELPLTEESVESIRELLNDPERRWYAERRLRALMSAGITAAADWNPLLHPRGVDGKFIQKFGVVRWLVGGSWRRGTVTNLTEKGVIVKPDRLPTGEPVTQGHPAPHIVFKNPTRQLYSAPTPKGYLKLPDITTGGEGWKKIGGQGGSNPGGLFVTTESIAPNFEMSMSQIDAAIAKVNRTTTKGRLDEAHLTINDDNIAVETLPKKGVITFVSAKTGKREVLFSPHGNEFDFSGFYGEGQWDDQFGTPGTQKRRLAVSTLQAWEARPAQNLTYNPALAAQDGLVAEAKAALGLVPLEATDPSVEIKPQTSFYVKKAKSPIHARNELLAASLYELAGVPAPAMFADGHDPNLVASEIVPDAEPITNYLNDMGVMKSVRENMVVDAWLANWDVAGAALDNIVVSDGVPYRIDTGGALQYRAQGGYKGSLFGSKVGEVTTLLDKSTNPAAAKVFDGTTLSEEKAGVERIAAIQPAQIRQAVEDAGVSPSVADTLIARRADLMKRFNIDEPKVLGTSPIPPMMDDKPVPTALSGRVWNPISESWVPGTAVDADVAETALNDFQDNLDSTVGSTVGPKQLVLIPKPGANENGKRRLFESKSGGYYAPARDLLDDFDGRTSSEYVKSNSRIVVTDHPEDVKKQYRELGSRFVVARMNQQINDMKTLKGIDDAASIDLAAQKPFDMIPKYTNLSGSPVPVAKRVGEGGYLKTSTFGLSKVDAISDDSVVITDLQGRTHTISGRSKLGVLWEPDSYTQSLFKAMVERDRLLDEGEPIEMFPSVPYIHDDATDTIVKVSGDEPSPPEWIPPPDWQGSLPGVPLEGTAPQIWVEGHYDLRKLQLDSLKTGSSEELQSLVGKTIVISLGEDDSILYLSEYNKNAVRNREGVWYVEGVSHGGTLPRLRIRSATGERDHIGYGTKEDADNPDAPQINVQVATNIDASEPRVRPTLRKNGDMVMEGVKIGTWSGDRYSSWRAHIDPLYSFTGTDFETPGFSYKKDIAPGVGRFVVPPPKPEVVEKSNKTKNIEKLVRADLPAPEFTKGQIVQAPDGLVGTVQGPVGGFPSLVLVKTDDDTIRMRNSFTLTKLDSYDDAIPVLPSGPNPYEGLTLADGKTPAIGQIVKAGRDDKIGRVIWATKPGSKQAKKLPLVKIRTDDGKTYVKTMSTTYLVKEAPPSFGTDVPAKAAAEALSGHSPPGVTIGQYRHMTPDGKRLIQPDSEREWWLGGSDKRRLTKDGYAPRIGMRMRTAQNDSVVVAGFSSVYKQPNQVILIDTDTGKKIKRQAHTLSVDNAAEFLSQTDPTLPSFSKIAFEDADALNLPTGTTIYRRTGTLFTQWYEGTRISRKSDQYFYVDEYGRIVELRDHPVTISKSPSDYFSIAVASGEIEKVGVIDEASLNAVALRQAGHGEPGPAGMTTVFAPYSPAEFSWEEAVANKISDLTEWKIDGAKPPETYDPKSSRFKSALGRPADAPTRPTDVGPILPPVTGKGAPLDQKAPLPSDRLLSPMSAALETYNIRESTEPGTGARYALADGDYIDDMVVRTQMARDLDSGQDYVEVSFRLREERAEEFADKALRAKDVTYGAWRQKGDDVYVTDLEKGDALSVRVSSTGVLKPTGGDSPNVRIVDKPEKIGTTGGVDVYRVKVVDGLGERAEVDIQLRGSPSVRRFDWDSNAVVQVPGGSEVLLTESASKDGWHEIGPIGHDRADLDAAISLAPDGTKLFREQNIKKTSDGASQASRWDKLGKKVERSFNDGTKVRINAVPSSVSGTSMGSQSSSGDIRRWNTAGEVTIRVPIDEADHPDDFQKSVSAAMEAVGIPPEAQGPATREQLAVFALNKVYKAYAPHFEHREVGVKTASQNDPGVVKVFSRMDRELGQYLGRPVSISDISIRISDQGLPQVLVSDEVADAMSRRQGRKYYLHSITNGGAEDGLYHIIAGTQQGLLSSDDRWGQGIIVQGMSSKRDLAKGSGNRVYFYPRSSNAPAENSGSIIVSANAINRYADVYLNSSDSFGTRLPENSFIKGYSGAWNEAMAKRAIPVEQDAYFIYNSPDKLIERLKASGLTEINGRPLEEVVVASGMDIDTTDPEFQKIGTHFGDEIPVEGLLA